MSDKSYVTLEKHQCLHCGKTHETGSLLMDTRLRERFDRHTLTGYSPCQECKRRMADGYIALIECDPSKTRVARDSAGTDRTKPRDAHCTGRSLWIKTAAFEHIFSAALPEGGMCYIEPDVYEMLAKMAAEADGHGAH